MQRDEYELISKPADTIIETLKAKDISFPDFMMRMAPMSQEDILLLMAGDLPIGIPVAAKLEAALGIDCVFWIERDRIYRVKINEAIQHKEDPRDMCRDFLFNQVSSQLERLKPSLTRAKDILEVDILFVKLMEDGNGRDLFLSHLQTAIRLLDLCGREFDLVNRLIEPLMMHPFTLTPRDLNDFLKQFMPAGKYDFPAEIQAMAFKYRTLSADGPLSEEAAFNLMTEIDAYCDSLKEKD